MGDTTKQPIPLPQEKVKIRLSEEKTRKPGYRQRSAEPFLYLPPEESLHLHLTVKNKAKTSGWKQRAGLFFAFPHPVLFVL